MRTGALEGVLTDAIARAADRPGDVVRRAAMLSGDLGETARLALTGTSAELDDVGLVVGRPVLPMLAATAPSAADAIATTGEASVEYKLDGARIQVHRAGDDVRVFTRNLADITHRLPEVVEVVRRMPVRDVILDGETLSLDEDGGPRPFQETMSRFGAEAARETLLHPWFFDVLHVDGRDLLDEPLSTACASSSASPASIASRRGDSRSRRRRAHLARRARRRPGGRRRQGDRLVLCGRPSGLQLDQGEARAHVRPRGARVRMGRPPRGVAVEPAPRRARSAGEFGEPGDYVMVGKTFKGLTDGLLRWQTEYFQQIEVRRTANTVWVAPTTVVEIAIDGVQRSTRYPGGIALRFARVKHYRDDKRPEDADTIQTLRALLRG